MPYTLLTRAENEAAEDAVLAPYACRSSRSRGRVHPERDDDPRLAYQRDRDRVLHSTAFRRLQYKTQVYVYHEGDFYRTRLTHSLEVAQISRGLAGLLRANEVLVEAIALCHDLGHPPFGHAGEEELKELMADHGGFEHNRQALRTVDRLEVRYADFPGLNLTWEVREGIVRHRSFFDDPAPPPAGFDSPQPSLEAQLVNLADMIAYCTHDIEDAINVGFVTPERLHAEVRLWREAWEERPAAGEWLRDMPGRAEAIRVRGTVRRLIHRLIVDAAEQTLARLNELGARSPDDIRSAPAPVACFSPEVAGELERLRDFLMDSVYRDPRTMRMTHKGRMILRRLWEAFNTDERLLPRRTRERLAAGEDAREQVICDFLAGMTDRHAMDLYNTLFQPYEPSLWQRG